MFYTWCKLEGRREFRTFEEIRLHWEQIKADPHARYWDGFGRNRNGGQFVSLERTAI